MTAIASFSAPAASGAANTPAIRIEGLRLTYAGRGGRPAHEALRGIDLEIPASQSVALLGPNGSGKSTLLRILSGMLLPDEGSVALHGRSDPEGIRRLLSVVFQTTGLDGHLTVEENLRCQSRLYGLRGASSQERIDAELDRAGLNDRRNAYVKTLSGGLKRRVDLARALLHQPRVLLLDEPTTGLDPAARAAFLDSIEQRRTETDMTILMSTHLIDEADRCERVVFIHEGRIVADGSPVELRRALGGSILTLHETTVDPPLLDGFVWRRTPGGWSAVLANSSQDASPVAEHLIAAHRPFTIAPPTLGDVFASLTGADLGAE